MGSNDPDSGPGSDRPGREGALPDFVWLMLLVLELLLVAAHFTFSDVRAGNGPRWLDLNRPRSFGSWLMTVQLAMAGLFILSVRSRVRAEQLLQRAAWLLWGALMFILSAAEATRFHSRFDLLGGDPSFRTAAFLISAALMLVLFREIAERARARAPRAALRIWLTAWLGALASSLPLPALWPPLARRFDLVTTTSVLYLIGATFLLMALAGAAARSPAQRGPSLLRLLITGAVILGVLHLVFHDVRVASVSWFDFDREGNLPTWFSVLAYLALGGMAIMAWMAESRSNREAGGDFPFPGIWWIVALFAALLSLDELAMIHENLRGLAVHAGTQGKAPFLVQWQIVLAPAGLVALCYFVLFFTSRYGARRHALRPALAGLGLWLFSQFVEGIHPLVMASGAWQYALAVLIEEEAEIFGAVLLMVSVQRYTRDVESGIPGVAPRRSVLFTRLGAVLAVAAALLFGAAALVVYQFALPRIVSPGQSRVGGDEVSRR